MEASILRCRACHRLARAMLLAIGLACVGGVVATTGEGTLQARIPTQADPAQQYDLFLPEGYPGNRHWPVLIILDPRGRTDWIMAQARRGAAANGWILLASYQSRSDDREQLTMSALQALLREVGARYAYDPKRVYIAGMSGTAKSLWVVERAMHGLVAGYIGAGGGRPPELGRLQGTPPPWFGFAGNHDFNFQEMRELDAELARVGTAHRLDVFEGEHGWPRGEGQFSDAIDWLELRAMHDGLAPRREDWMDAQLVKARTRATGEKNPLERWRYLDALIRDFDGLRAVDAERAEAAQLHASAELQAALKQEQRLHDEEARFVRQLDDWASQLNRPISDGNRRPPPDLRATLAALRITSLKARATGPDPVVADSAMRRLERTYVAGAHYMADALQARGELERTRAALELARAVFPDRAYARCRLQTLGAGAAAPDAGAVALANCLQLDAPGATLRLPAASQ